MKKFRAIVVALAVMLSVVAAFTTASVGTASAWLTSCSASFHGTPGSFGQSLCTNHNAGGNNLQRVVVVCEGPVNVYYAYNGPWVLEDYYSRKFCPGSTVPVQVWWDLL